MIYVRIIFPKKVQLSKENNEATRKKVRGRVLQAEGVDSALPVACFRDSKKISVAGERRRVVRDDRPRSRWPL